MNAEQRSLWRKVEDFSLDDSAVPQPFAAQLAKEQNWTPGFAGQAITEYKKFAFLSVVAGHKVVPGAVIDEVWHLHLTYTDNYLNSFCFRTLGQPMRHLPTGRSVADEQNHKQWYAQTLESYRTHFGEEPPRAFWSRSPLDVAAPCGFEVTLPIPKPTVFATPWIWIALAIASVGLMGISSRGNIVDLLGYDFLSRFLGLTIVTVATAFAAQFAMSAPSRLARSSATPLDAYQVAYLAGGLHQTALAGITGLLSRGILSRSDNGYSTTTIDLPEKAHPVERLLVHYFSVSRMALRDVDRILEPWAGVTEQELTSRGLWTDHAELRSIRTTCGLITALPMALGLWKMQWAYAHAMIPSLLTTLFVLLVIVSLVFVLQPSRRTWFGTQVLNQIKLGEAAERVRLIRTGTYEASDVVACVALFGMEVLDGLDIYHHLQQLHSPSMDVAESYQG